MSIAGGLRERLAQLFADSLNIDVPTAETDLFDAGVLDSLAFVELILLLQREFGVQTSVDDLQVENFKSVSSIADFILSRGSLSKASAPREIAPLAMG